MSNSPAAPVPASVIVPAGATRQSFSVTAAPVSSSQMASVTATTGTISVTGTLTVNPIVAVSVSSVSFAPASVTGGTGSTGTVTLSAAAPASGATVALASADSSVGVPASVVVPAGSTSQMFAATTTGVPGAKNVQVTATLGTSTASATLTVNPATILSVAFSPASVIGGASSTGTVALSGPAPPAGFTVSLASNMTGVATVPASFNFPGGAQTGTFIATTSPQGASVSATVTATLASGNSMTGTLTVMPPVVSLLSFNPATVGFGQTSTGTVTLNGNAPSGGFPVSLVSSDPGAVPVPGSVLVAAGTMSQTFLVTGGAVSSPTPVTVTASTGSASAMGMLTVNPALMASPASIVFGSGTLVGVPSSQTITLTNTSSVSVAITSISASSEFSPANTCPGTLAAGTSCVITLTPLQGGNLTGNVTILSNAGNSSLTINLSGTAMHWVALSWTGSTTPGATYDVYRQLQSGGTCGVPSTATYAKVNSSPITTTNYNDTDASLIAGNTYCYSATAVEAGSQSTFVIPAVPLTIPSP